MSHVAEVSPESVIPKEHLYFLRMAVENNCKGEVEMVLGQSEYRNWVTDHGKLYGDYDPPEGLPVEMIGKGALAVIRMTGEKLSGIGKSRHASGSPYEIGLVPVAVTRDAEGGVKSWKYDADGDHVVPVADFFNQGNGLLSCPGIGEHSSKYVEGKKQDTFAAQLMQNYQLERVKHAAKIRGETLAVERQENGDIRVTVDTTATVGY